MIQNENTHGVRALCLDPHDLALAKYAAGREKDLAFNREMATHGITQQRLLLQLLEEMPLDGTLRELVLARIHRDFAGR